MAATMNTIRASALSVAYKALNHVAQLDGATAYDNKTTKEVCLRWQAAYDKLTQDEVNEYWSLAAREARGES